MTSHNGPGDGAGEAILSGGVAPTVALVSFVRAVRCEAVRTAPRPNDELAALMAGDPPPWTRAQVPRLLSS